MKKAFNILLAAGTLFIATACMEDKGTSFEVASANDNERVDPDHISDYYGLDTLARMVTRAGSELPQNGQLATEIVKAYYLNDRKLNEVKRMYNFSETALMGGQTTQADTSNPDVTSASNDMEQKSMQTVQDSVNEVTGGSNKEDAKPKQGEKAKSDARATQKDKQSNKQ